MRASNKSSILTGVALLLLAALFSISLILLPLDYGVSGPGHNNILYLLGDMLYTVYGFCSILIPGFLLVSGLSCFASKWTARKTLRLLTALIPFFTCVLTESIIRSILKVDHSPFAIAKILIALVTGAMLVVIEYLGTGIIADRLNNGGFKNLRTKSVNKPALISKNIEAEDISESDDSDESEETETDLPEFKKLSKLKVPKETLFGKLKKKFKKDEEDDDDDDEDEDELSGKKASIFDQILDDIQPYEQDTVSDEEVEEKTDATPEAAQASMLSQEEFAALTTPADELEWPGLPPQPKNLPPEYDADFDENDPALEFPPKDEVEKPAATTETTPSASTTPAAPTAPVAPVAPADNNDPYAATRYIDSVVENPLYPHKIVIDDGSERLRELDVQKIYTGHCTGAGPYQVMKKQLLLKLTNVQ